MNITVLAKQVPDTYMARHVSLETGMLERGQSDPIPDEVNERALEVALRFKDAHPDTQVTLLCMGPSGAGDTLRKLLALGADRAVLVTDENLAGSDAVQTARVLAAAINYVGGDLVLAGNETTDGRGGVVPAMVSEILALPYLPAIDDLDIGATAVSGTIQVEGGSLDLTAPLPAIASVTEKSPEPRFANFKSIMAAKKKPLDVLGLADLGIEAGPDAATVRNVMVSATQRPPRDAGTKIVDDGNAAARIADFLASRRVL